VNIGERNQDILIKYKVTLDTISLGQLLKLGEKLVIDKDPRGECITNQMIYDTINIDFSSEIDL